jgi:hypothetical protein
MRYTSALLVGLGVVLFLSGWIAAASAGYDAASLLRVLIGAVLMVGGLLLVALRRIEDKL